MTAPRTTINRAGRLVALTGLALGLLAACGGPGNGTAASGPAVAASAGGPASEDASAPAAEGTGPESPLARTSKPSLSEASLPIGGGGFPTSSDGRHVCVTLAFTGHIPAGITIFVTGVQVTVSSFAVDATTTGGCEDDSTSCLKLELTDTGSSQCLVSLRWNGEEPRSGSVGLVAGQCQGADTAGCQQVLNDLSQDTSGVHALPFTIDVPDTGSPPADSGSPGATGTT